MSDATPTYCYVHPSREASLRCNRCERPICPACAVLTPIGYRCKECIRGQQKIFDTSQTIDFPLAFFVAGALSLIGSILAGFFGFWGLLVAPAAGMGTSEVVRWVIRRHRSPALFLTAAAGAALGAAPVVIWNLLTGNFWAVIIAAAYAVIITPTVYYRLRGIQVR